MISVIIPAHNEAAVIRRGLEYLLAGARPGELEVIVACNGCTDETAALARAFGPPVQVLEIPTASKTAALNAAEAVATAFPRVYMDADVRLDIASVRRLAAALDNSEGVLLVAPRLRMDLRPTTWLVRAFYEVWTRLPYNQTMVGTGAYALSCEARARFGAFPDVIADDGFVRFQFRLEERRTVDAAEVWVAPPPTVNGLVKIKTRSRLGGYQLRHRWPERATRDRQSAASLLGWAMHNPGTWLYLPAYVSITLWTRLRARRRLATLAQFHWERDESRDAVGAVAKRV